MRRRLKRRARRLKRRLGILAYAFGGAALHAVAGRPEFLTPGPSPLDLLRVLH